MDQALKQGTEALADVLMDDLVQRVDGEALGGEEGDAVAPPPPSHVAKREKTRICDMCGAAAKYRCPGCRRESCSVGCVKAHKEKFDCKGQRRAEFVAAESYSDYHLQDDYRFLERFSTVLQRFHKALPSHQPFSIDNLPTPLHYLREACKKRGVHITLLSRGLEKHRRNLTRFIASTDTILWRVDFVVHYNGERHTMSRLVNERYKLREVISNMTLLRERKLRKHAVWNAHWEHRRRRQQQFEQQLAPLLTSEKPRAPGAHTGMVTRWDNTKGYGFVRIEGDTSDVFMHRNALLVWENDHEYRVGGTMVIGEIVEFDITTDEGTGKRRGANVTGAGVSQDPTPPPANQKALHEFLARSNAKFRGGDGGAADNGGGAARPQRVTWSSPTEPPPATGPKGRKPCDFFWRSGRCKHGDRCGFEHVAPTDVGVEVKLEGGASSAEAIRSQVVDNQQNIYDSELRVDAGAAAAEELTTHADLSALCDALEVRADEGEGHASAAPAILPPRQPTKSGGAGGLKRSYDDAAQEDRALDAGAGGVAGGAAQAGAGDADTPADIAWDETRKAQLLAFLEKEEPAAAKAPPPDGDVAEPAHLEDDVPSDVGESVASGEHTHEQEGVEEAGGEGDADADAAAAAPATPTPAGAEAAPRGPAGGDAAGPAAADGDDEGEAPARVKTRWMLEVDTLRAENQTAANRHLLRGFMKASREGGKAGYKAYMRAERLGVTAAYHKIDTDQTLAEILRNVRYVVEYPTLELVIPDGEADAERDAALITEEHLEQQRTVWQVSMPKPEAPPMSPAEKRKMRRIPCKYFTQKGRCNSGDDCLFLHTFEIPFCKTLQNLGMCPLKERCFFSHRRYDPEDPENKRRIPRDLRQHFLERPRDRMRDVRDVRAEIDAREKGLPLPIPSDEPEWKRAKREREEQWGKGGGGKKGGKGGGKKGYKGGGGGGGTWRYNNYNNDNAWGNAGNSQWQQDEWGGGGGAWAPPMPPPQGGGGW